MAHEITSAISNARIVHKKMYRREPKLLIVSLDTLNKIKNELYKDTHIDYRTIPLSVYEGMRIKIDNQKEEGWEIVVGEKNLNLHHLPEHTLYK